MSNILAKIDVTKIDKNKLFAGQKGTYLDLVLIETPNGQYGDFMIVQDAGREARERKEKGIILGNGKFMVKRAAQSSPASEPAKRYYDRPEQGGDIPF